MAKVSTHLFYGVFVTTSSLIIAAKAFSRVQSPFLAIDLILSRKRNSTLPVQIDHTSESSFDNSGNGDVTRLPEEIWGIIKHELLEIELDSSECELIKEWLCFDCRPMHFDKFHNRYTLLDCWHEFLRYTYEGGGSRCDTCLEHQVDIVDDPWNKDLGYIYKVNDFLASINLKLIMKGKVARHDCDLKLLSPIGISSGRSHSCQPFNESTPFDAITSLSSAAFKLPSSRRTISRRFDILENVYRVEIGDYETTTKDFQNYENNLNDAKEREEQLIDSPSWKLWTQGVIFD